MSQTGQQDSSPAGATPRRIGVFGGTFDPIHVAHLVVANQALAQCQLDEVIFVPAAQPQLKPGPPSASAIQRLAMTQLATAGSPQFIVSTVDLDREGPTYTVDTLRDLQSQQAAHSAGQATGTAAVAAGSVTANGAGAPPQWFFIVGADAFSKIASWHNVETLARLTHFIVVTRDGYDVLPPKDISAVCTTICIPRLEISSSDCRDRVRHGHSIRYLVPDKVWQYIQDHGLYRQPSSAPEGVNP